MLRWQWSPISITRAFCRRVSMLDKPLDVLNGNLKLDIELGSLFLSVIRIWRFEHQIAMARSIGTQAVNAPASEYLE